MALPGRKHTTENTSSLSAAFCRSRLSCAMICLVAFSAACDDSVRDDAQVQEKGKFVLKASPPALERTQGAGTARQSDVTSGKSQGREQQKGTAGGEAGKTGAPLTVKGGKQTKPEGDRSADRAIESGAEVSSAIGPAREASAVAPVNLPDFAATYEKVAPSVVKISAVYPSIRTPGGTRTDLSGTGFFFGEPGEILTNAAVVRGASSFTVETSDGRNIPAILVGKDPYTDIALLRVDLENCPPPLAIASEGTVKPGMWVLAVGNPLGLEFSAVKGIVSALNRTDVLWDRVGYWDFIQTDLAINMGDSGGPVVNAQGEVIGLSVAMKSEAKRISFAIPISTASVVVSHLKKHGRLQRAWLGMQIVEEGGQVKVVGIYPDSPAQSAGLKLGDVILELNGQKVEGVSRLRWNIAIQDVDRSIQLKIARSGVESVLEAKLATAPDFRERAGGR